MKEASKIYFTAAWIVSLVVGILYSITFIGLLFGIPLFIASGKFNKAKDMTDEDLIKKYSVSLPITDMEKRTALKDKTGFDVDKAIENAKADKEVEAPKTGETAKTEPVAAAPTGRRTTTNYKVVNKE